MIKAIGNVVSRAVTSSGQWAIDFVLSKLVPEHHDLMVMRKHEKRMAKLERNKRAESGENLTFR